MKSKRKETEKNNRREALSAIILSYHTINLVGSEPTTNTNDHATIYHNILFRESCRYLYLLTFIFQDSSVFCTPSLTYRIWPNSFITIPYQKASHSPTRSAARHLRKPLSSLPGQKTRYPCQSRNNRSQPFLRPYKPLP